jgi:hypothetical protein
MTGNFERRFKQCDESILNGAARETFGNISLGKTPRRGVSQWRERPDGTEHSSEAMKRGGEARQSS